MNIIVTVAALRSGGGLTIYNQFIKYLPICDKINSCYIFLDKGMPHPAIPNVEYIDVDLSTWNARIKFIYSDIKVMLDDRHIVPDVIISLENTGFPCLKNYKTIVYYHQPLPLFPHKWNLFKRSERYLFLYKYLYPIIVRSTIGERTHFVTQIPFIKKRVELKYKLPSCKVHALFPDIEKLNIDNVEPWNFNKRLFHFLYVAGRDNYKNHKILIKALESIRQSEPELLQNIRLHFTISKDTSPNLYKLVKKADLLENVLFEDRQPHEDILRQYKSANALLFPSEIETLGLPLLEAAAFGLPIIAADLEYAHEVIGQYEGITFVGTHNYEGWKEEILRILRNPKRYTPYSQNSDSSWITFFNLINQI